MPTKHHVRRRSRPSGAQSLSEKTSTNGCSTCLLYTTKHLGLPFRNRTSRLRACMFLVFGCCIRLASSFTAYCSTCLDLDSWPASSTIGSKLDPLHQALCHLLRQSSEHHEYSQLCFRCSVPSLTPGFPSVTGWL